MNKVEYLLTCLVEECSEVQKEATKALRFGLKDKWESDDDQATKIVNEFIDLVGVFEMLVDEGVLVIPSNPNQMINNKKRRLITFMDYAVDRGTLTL